MDPREKFYEDKEALETEEGPCDHVWGPVWTTFAYGEPRLETRCILCGARPQPGDI